MELVKKNSAHSVDRRHEEQFVGWFERKVSANLFILLGLSCTSPEKISTTFLFD
jgi:hypothetical protein